MKYWNVSPEKQTIRVAGIDIAPGESADLPVHANAEVSPWLLRGWLTFIEPPKPKTQEPPAQPVKSEEELAQIRDTITRQRRSGRRE